MPYVKIDTSILESTVWRESHQTLRVWMTLLAMKNPHGEVRSSIPGLADRARVTLAECETALGRFLSPDPYSRTKDFEGRRIQEIDGGWYVINHDKYRELDDPDERKAKAAERARRYRGRKRDERDASRDERDERDESRAVTPRTQKSRQAVSSKQLSGINSSTTTTTAAKSGKLTELSPEAREAVSAARKESRSPKTFDAMLKAVHKPPTGGAAYSWAIIGAALVEMVGNGEKVSAARLRGFCRKLTQPEPPSGSNGHRPAAPTPGEELRALLAKRRKERGDE